MSVLDSKAHKPTTCFSIQKCIQFNAQIPLNAVRAAALGEEAAGLSADFIR